MRNLCTIQTIAKVTPIAGKDRIQLASFESTSWNVIVGKDMNPGDKVIYCESDTLLPVRPEFEFLRARCYVSKYDAFRIRFMKLGPHLSEGICFPSSVFPGIKLTSDGLDVTEQLGARKYDPEIVVESEAASKAMSPLKKALMRFPFFRKLFAEKPKGDFPIKLIGKTDETRIQTISSAIDTLGTRECYVTEKVDGMSRTYIFSKGKFIACSRNLRLPKDELAEKYDLPRRMKKLAKQVGDFAIQAEAVGPGIQGNKYGLKAQELFVFNMKSLLGRHGQYLNPFAEGSWMLIQLGLQTVPLLHKGTLPFSTVEEGVLHSDGYSELNAEVLREGIVVRPWNPNELKPMRGMSNMFSFKIINPSFLLKWEK